MAPNTTEAQTHPLITQTESDQASEHELDYAE